MLMLKMHVQMYNYDSITHAKIQMHTHEYQDCLFPDVFRNLMSKRVQDMEYVKTSILS
jgi:hypothetical protein